MEATTSRISSPRLIGRDAELAELRVLLDEAGRGAGGAVLIGGEAGVGKSRLVRQVADEAATRGFRVLRGASVDFGEGGLPFGAIAEALRPVGRELASTAGDRLGAGVTELARLLPDLGHAAEPAPDIRRDPHATARLFEVILRLLETVAADAPVLLVLEDLHWADPSTRELFAFLARNAAGTRLLVAATYRSDELHRNHPLRPLLATLRSGDEVHRIELGALDRDAVAALVAGILGRDPDAALVDRVHERGHGNAFFTEELLASEQAGDRLPASLREMLLLRVDATGPDTRAVLQALAVIGRPASEALVTATTGLDADRVTAALRDAIDRAIVVRAGGPEDELSFRHALFAEAVYGDLLQGERARLHRAVAAALTAGRAGRATEDDGVDAELALHHRRGNEPAEALAAAARAAASAASRYAFAESLAQWEAVLELWEQVPAAREVLDLDRHDVMAEAAIAASSAGQHRRAIALIRGALAAVDPEREPLRAAFGEAALMAELFAEGDRDGAEPARTAALALLEGQPPSIEQVRVLNLTAYPPLFESRYAEVAESATRALALAESLGAEREIALARVPLGIAVAFMGRLDEGEAHFEAALRIAQADGHPQPLADAYLAWGVVLEAAGRFDAAVAVLREGAAELRRLGVDRTHASTIHANLAEALRRLGRWSEALEVIEAVLARAGTGWESAHGHLIRGHLLIAAGRGQEGEAAVLQARRQFPRAGVGFVGQLHAALAEHAFWRGEYRLTLDEATAGFDEIRGSADLRWLGELAVWAARARRHAAELPGSRGTVDDRAVALVDDYAAIGRAAESAGTIFAGEFGANLATARAELADTDEGPEADRWTTVGVRWEELAQLYPAAIARFRAAEALLRSGASRDAASEAAADAIARARSIGAGALASAIEDLARRGRLDLARASEVTAARPSTDSRPGADPLRLTARERDVLALLADGRSDQEIADALFISPKTASVHVSNLKAKLGVERRVEAALIAARALARADGETAPR